MRSIRSEPWVRIRRERDWLFGYCTRTNGVPTEAAGAEPEGVWKFSFSAESHSASMEEVGFLGGRLEEH